MAPFEVLIRESAMIVAYVALCDFLFFILWGKWRWDCMSIVTFFNGLISMPPHQNGVLILSRLLKMNWVRRGDRLRVACCDREPVGQRRRIISV